MPPMVTTDSNIVVTSSGEVRWRGDHERWSAIRHPHLKYVESFMDETCRGNHEWTFDSTRPTKRAPRGGIEFCKQCGRLNELTQTLRSKGSASTARHSTLKVGCIGKPTSTHQSEIRARTNVDQIVGIMHQDGLPKRAMRTARRLFFH